MARLNTRLLNGLSWFEPGEGGGGTPYDGKQGAASPERGIFFRLQVYERARDFTSGSILKGREICHLGL